MTWMDRIGKVVAGFAVALLCLGTSVATGTSAGAAAGPPAQTTAADAFTGTIVVHGCQVASEDLLVRARPLYPPNPVTPSLISTSYQRTAGAPAPLGTEIGGRASDGNRSQVVRPQAKADGTFEFTFTGLTPVTPYRVGVKLTGPSRARCTQLVWDASRDPLIMAGGEPLALDAYVVNSRLGVLGPARQGRPEAAWVAADLVDFDDPVAAVRQFRWLSTDPVVTGGRLQVSTKPFPRVGGRVFNPCAEDVTAIAYQHDFTAVPGEWATIPLDLNAIVYGGRTGSPGNEVPPRASAAAIDPDGSAAIDENMRTLIELGHPLYVRVLPTENGEPVCDPGRGVPADALLAKALKTAADLLGAPQFEVTEIVYDTPFINVHPKSDETCYRVTQDHVVDFFFGTVWDQLAHKYMNVAYGDTATSVFPNNMFCVPNDTGDDGWFESFVSDLGAVLTGLVDEVAKLVNSASALWEKIQDYAVKATAAGLKTLGVPCDSTCEAALEMGLEVTLATMGVPPSIPNFDQLVDQGIDYAVAQVASQVGVPSEVANLASGEAKKFVKEAAADMKARPYSIPKLPAWLVPDIRFNPAVLTLKVRRTQNAIGDFESRPGLIRDNDPIYYGRFALLPRKMPGYTETPLTFPMVLEPNLNDLPLAPSSKCSSQQFAAYQQLLGAEVAAATCNTSAYESAVWDKNKWIQLKYTNGCYRLRLTGLSPLGDHVFVMANLAFRTETAQPCQLPQ